MRLAHLFVLSLLCFTFNSYGGDQESEANCAQFSFDVTNTSPDVELLDFHYGNSGIKGTFVEPGKPTPQSGGVSGGDLKGDRLYVKWINKRSNKVFSNDVLLKGHLPVYSKACNIYFAIKNDQLYVFMLTNQIMPKGTPGVDRNKTPLVTDIVKVFIVYPYGKLSVDVDNESENGLPSKGSATSEAGWRERRYQDARKPGVMAQFCVFETKLPGYLYVSQVLRRSLGSALTRHIGNSTSGQFIYQSYLGKLEEFTAAIASPFGQEQYIFLSKKSLYSTDSWSEWVSPDIVSSDRHIPFKLLYGKDVVKEITGPMIVLARFKVGSYVQWREATDSLREQNLQSNLEACPLTPNLQLP